MWCLTCGYSWPDYMDFCKPCAYDKMIDRYEWQSAELERLRTENAELRQQLATLQTAALWVPMEDGAIYDYLKVDGYNGCWVELPDDVRLCRLVAKETNDDAG